MTKFPYIKDAKSSYRHRGFLCGNCAWHSMIFGDGSDPTVCPNCNTAGQLKKEWDHWVTESTHVQDYVAPQDSIDAGVSGAI